MDLQGSQTFFFSISNTDIITITHAPGPQAQARAKVTALRDLNRLNSAISAFPPSVSQLPWSRSVPGRNKNRSSFGGRLDVVMDARGIALTTVIVVRGSSRDSLTADTITHTFPSVPSVL